MESVSFINCEDDGTDQIVSFALAYGEMEIRSLTLLRTPKFEVLLDESERGVSVSLEHEIDEDADLLDEVTHLVEAPREVLFPRTKDADDHQRRLVC